MWNIHKFDLYLRPPFKIHGEILAHHNLETWCDILSAAWCNILSLAFLRFLCLILNVLFILVKTGKTSCGKSFVLKVLEKVVFVSELFFLLFPNMGPLLHFPTEAIFIITAILILIIAVVFVVVILLLLLLLLVVVVLN